MKKYRKIGIVGPFIACAAALLIAPFIFGVSLFGSDHANAIFGAVIFFTPQVLFFSLIGYLVGSSIDRRSSENNKNKPIIIYLAIVLVYFLLLIKFI